MQTRQSLDTAKKEREAANKERETAKKEREAANKEREARRQAEMQTQQLLDTANKEREAANEEREAANKEREAANKEREARLQAETEVENERQSRLKQMLEQHKINNKQIEMEHDMYMAAKKVHTDCIAELNHLQANADAEDVRLDKFKVIRTNPDWPRVFLVGKTGGGKSTIVCRFSSIEAVRNHPTAKGGPAPRGRGMKSCTQDFQFYPSVVADRRMYILDPPGHNDTRGDEVDAANGNTFAAQTKGCGGYSAILLVTTMTDKATTEFCSMIHFYRDLFGPELYKRLAVVVTHVDAPDAKDEYEEHGIQKEIEDTMLGLTGCAIPVIPIGYRNFKEARHQLCKFIPKDNHEPNFIKSPLDKLKEDIEGKKAQVGAAHTNLQKIKQRIENLRRRQHEVATFISELGHPVTIYPPSRKQISTPAPAITTTLKLTPTPVVVTPPGSPQMRSTSYSYSKFLTATDTTSSAFTTDPESSTFTLPKARSTPTSTTPPLRPKSTSATQPATPTPKPKRVLTDAVMQPPTPTRESPPSVSPLPQTGLGWQEIVRLPALNEATVAEGMSGKFHNLCLIGKGGFGEVYKAAAGDCAQHFALKRQMLNVDSKGIKEYLHEQERKIFKKLEGLRREAKIYCSPTLNNGQTRHLTLLYDIASVTHANAGAPSISEPLLAMEWANAQPYNTLKAWMEANPVSDESIQERLSFTIQMFSGLVKLHHGGHAATNEETLPLFVHQDVKPENMLLFGHGPKGSGPFRLALTDFGLSVCYNGTPAEAACGGGTRLYMAPEQWLGKPARGPGRDIWAAGMVVAKLFASKSVMKALKDYQDFCKQISCVDIRCIEELCRHAKDIACAVEEDGRQMPGSQLSLVQKDVAPLLDSCFRVGRELKGANEPGNTRPKSSHCTKVLKQIWDNLFSSKPWQLYCEKLPQPRPTALQSKSRHYLWNLFLEQMEIPVLEMMLHRNERLLNAVNPSDRPTVQERILDLKKQIRQTSEKAKSNRSKSLKEDFAVVKQDKVNMRLHAPQNQLFHIHAYYSGCSEN